jgi:hypothetical protein
MGVTFLIVWIIILAVMVSLCFGWLIPLIIGLVKWRRKTGGKWWLVSSGVWGVLAAAWIGFCVYSAISLNRRYASETFNAETYTGERATLVLPYSGSGTLSIRQVNTGKSLRVVFSETNSVVVPAGTLTVWHLSYEEKDATGVVAGGMNCSLEAKENIVAQANDVITLPGGVPLTASITAKKQAEDKIQIDYALTDVAGNRISMWGRSSEKGNPKFEAIGPDGACFWSSALEYG